MWGQVGAHKKASVRTLASGSNVRVLAVPCFHFHDFITGTNNQVLVLTRVSEPHKFAWSHTKELLS
ncbi:hypothetical protein BDA96_09G197900 [Sorghum bicolor]|uniref:Uncharacterized protein n=2 Tax=Sorghum bicolor TaxID=4558 RepID=A0A921QBJ7_SORBI|nr:hypothetical protein BDA96_09G197900 [Sorghum bicolor]OQU78255.1 hypothetical protein SORBI_3009G187150 [Sorghum bicolor]